MRESDTTVSEILPGSIAEEAGIEPGDSIMSINGEKIKDIFDYRFLTANESLLLELRKKDGEVWEVEIEKDEYEDLGVEFVVPMIEEPSSCTNQCIFCFIDQLPEGMRDTLYFKDDDSRLSFLSGNYVTLTNIRDEDLDRILRYRMSPINVSVHTTNPELRMKMLNNRFAGDVLEKIKKLADGGIVVNCQIVLCRGVNDGRELDRTLSDLTETYPGVSSISVVPVGITKHRQGLCELQAYDREAAEVVVRQVEEWQEQLLVRFGTRIVYLADEFYLMADREIPDHEAYEDFPQIENGVGLIALLRQEFYEDLDTYKAAGPRTSRRISIATGVSACGFIKQLAAELEKEHPSLEVNVFEIKNDFFGENVTVTGLLTGGDIVSQLFGKELGEELLLARSMLKSGEELFLDDTTVDMIQEKLNVKITIVENNGRDFIKKVLGVEH